MLLDTFDILKYPALWACASSMFIILDVVSIVASL